MAILVLFPLSAMGINFEQDNPDDKVVRLRCGWMLREFNYERLAIGMTPLSIYDKCMQITRYYEEKHEKESSLKDPYNSSPSDLPTTASECEKLYKNALKAIHNCDASSKEKELREIKEQESRCKSSCTETQKRCYLRDEFLLSSRYAYGKENRDRLCGLFNYLSCISWCKNDYIEKRNTIIKERKDEERDIEASSFTNYEVKQRYIYSDKI
jgi:DNA gyrase/topoisomerase IV subunit A